MPLCHLPVPHRKPESNAQAFSEANVGTLRGQEKVRETEGRAPESGAPSTLLRACAGVFLLASRSSQKGHARPERRSPRPSWTLGGQEPLLANLNDPQPAEQPRPERRLSG